MPVYRLTADLNTDPEVGASPNRIVSVRFAAPMHCHDFYEFFLIVSGSCRHLVNGGVQRLAEGALVFIRPDDTHAYDYDGKNDCEFVNIPCAAELIREAFRYLGGEPFARRYLAPAMPPVVILSQVERKAFLTEYEKLRVLSSFNKPYARLFLKGLIAETFTSYFSADCTASSNTLPGWLESLLAEMQKKENFTAGLSRMYALSKRSPGHLNRAFRQYLSMTPVAYINGLRLDYAKVLLLSTELPIVDVAFESGFNNLSHFYHLFHGEYGMAPAELRKRRKTI